MRAPNRFLASCPWTLPVLLVLLLGPFTGCDFVDDDAPSVLAVEVIPSTITAAETGDTSQFFEIEISTENFLDEIETAAAFIGNQQRYAEPGNIVVNDNVVTLEEISYTWFTQMGPGVYDIGVEVESATAFTREFNRATVTIE